MLMADDGASEGWTLDFRSRLLHSLRVASVDSMNCLTVTIEMPWYVASFSRVLSTRVYAGFVQAIDWRR
jgi:hypothetical protein